MVAFGAGGAFPLLEVGAGLFFSFSRQARRGLFGLGLLSFFSLYWPAALFCETQRFFAGLLTFASPRRSSERPLTMRDLAPLARIQRLDVNGPFFSFLAKSGFTSLGKIDQNVLFGGVLILDIASFEHVTNASLERFFFFPSGEGV